MSHMLIQPAGSQSTKSYPADAFKRATLRSVRCPFTIGAERQTDQQEKIQSQFGWPHPAPFTCLINTENVFKPQRSFVLEADKPFQVS